MASSDNSVFRSRIQRAQQEMERQGVDFLFVAPSSDLVVLLGYPALTWERLTLMGVRGVGEPFVVVPTLEAVRLEDRKDIVEIRAWDETESPYQLVAQLVVHAEGAASAVGDQMW